MKIIAQKQQKVQNSENVRKVSCDADNREGKSIHSFMTDQFTSEVDNFNGSE